MKLLSLLVSILSLGLALELGQIPKTIVLEGDKGAQVNGEAFSSEILKTKLHILFYVDPDEKEMNEHVSSALKEQNFDKNAYASVAIINMAATWLPNFAIASKLKSKQETYPDTLYVKDLQSVLVKEWDLKDDSSNVVLFAKDGRVLFIKKGKLSSEETLELISLIQDNI
ncbi:transcriptional regulator [Sulfurimonas sp. MAG313]|nr:YtfJ family protein [Sulfurimonas sp. MAG313]MDF1882190.1 transcriptional regulator [Sulfurimonas sp. MAG313]